MCIVGLQVALEFNAYVLSVFRDSLLITSQIKGKWQDQDTKLILYQKCVNCLILKFQNNTFAYLPQAHNQFTNALTNLASMVKLAEGDDMRQLRIMVSGVSSYMRTSRNAWMSKLRSMESHDTMILRLISRMVNTCLEPWTVIGSLSGAWRANSSWVGKSCIRGTTIQLSFNA